MYLGKKSAQLKTGQAPLSTILDGLNLPKKANNVTKTCMPRKWPTSYPGGLPTLLTNEPESTINQVRKQYTRNHQGKPVYFVKISRILPEGTLGAMDTLRLNGLKDGEQFRIEGMSLGMRDADLF